MGKCKIITHDGSGLYTVLMLPDYSRVDTEIGSVNGKLIDVTNVELVQAEADYLEKKNETDAVQAQLDFAIATYASDPTPENFDTVEKLVDKMGAAVIEESKVKIPYEQVKARKLTLEKRLIQLFDSIVIQVPIQLWCADLSDGVKDRKIYVADDEVGTIEILGEDANGINLQPQYLENGHHIDARDGFSMPTIVMTPATYFYNRAMLPSWQKWQYVYRTGIITGVTATGFAVTLDDIRSAEQNPFIPVNDLNGGSLINVTAEYLNCNEAAFTIDDHVIIQTTYDAERNRFDVIIGFVDNPKPCDLSGFNYHPFVIGGTQPGFHDWQNIRPNPITDWVMNTPVLTDVITDGTGPKMRDWKGKLNDGENILAQWEHRGDNIYIDGVKKAVTPNFTLSLAAGDPSAAQVPSGFYAAWVTKDNQYIYAVPYEITKSTHVLRKTNVEELTGNAYNATTDPDGWEVSAAFGPSSYTDFIFFGEIKINESGTEGKSMDSWVHGAHRTPQADPGSGAAWRAPSEYFTGWVEESQLDIATPSAATINAAGITYQFNGLVGSQIYQNDQGYSFTNHSGKVTCGTDWYATGIRTDWGQLGYEGDYAHAVGFDGDTVAYLKTKGIGTYEFTHTWSGFNTCLDCPPGSSQDGLITTYAENKTATTTVGGYGTVNESDFETWTIPVELFDENETISMSMQAPTCSNGGTFCEIANYNQSWENFIHTGGMEFSDVTNGIYRIRTDETHQTRIASYGGTASGGGGLCPGNLSTSKTDYERGILELGATEKILERIESSSSFSGPADIDPFIVLFPDMFLTYDPGADPTNPTPPAPSITKFNWTAHISTFGLHSTHWLEQEAAKDFKGNYISWDQNQYNDLLTTVYENYLTNGDLNSLDGLDNGDGTKYLFPHVANS